MIPIRDYPHSNKRPFVTMGLILANIIVFFLEFSSPDLDTFIRQYALTPAFVSFMEPQTLYTFISSQFLHGDFIHLGMNMWFLWIFGDNVEEDLGRPSYLIFYLLGGIVAALAQYVALPDSNIPMLGASGAVSAVLGYYLIRFPHHKVETLFYYSRFMMPAIWFLFLWFFLQVVSGLGSLGVGGDIGGVAWWAHIGGFIFGVIIAKLLTKKIPKNGSRFMDIRM